MKTDQTTHPRRRRGFTIIELSVVLVVVALLAGGVMVGRDLIGAARIRQTMSDKDKIIQSTRIFKDKYFCLPGDCRAATSFFGSDPQSCGPRGKTPKTQTCNGNGDEKINIVDETMLIWQHLNAAGLWRGPFRGGYAASPIFIDAYSLPVTPLNSGLFYDVGHADNMSGVLRLDGLPYVNHHITFNSDAVRPSIRPTEAQAVDTKYDDGKPASGSMVINADQTTCINVAGVNSSYLTTTNTGDCYPYFPNVF
jgi:prepilin-type N-terminal cleavage/methylation domain-containing protein